MGSAPAGQTLHAGAGCVSVHSHVWYRAKGANTRLHAGAGDVSIPRHVCCCGSNANTCPNPYGELGSKRGRPEGSTYKATARKPGPNARTLAAKKVTSASQKITSMFERSPAVAGSSSSSALPLSTNGPVPRLRGSTYSSSSSSSSSRTGNRESGPSSGSRSARPNGAPQSSTSFGANF